MQHRALFDRRRMLAMSASAGWAFVGANFAEAAPNPSTARPDFTGTWSNGSYTLLRRPKELKTLIITPVEAEVYEAPRRALSGQTASPTGTVGQAESEFNDQGEGLARIRGEVRTSWITDPADGQIPYTKEAADRLGIGKDLPEKVDNPEDRPTLERCLTSLGSNAPILNSHDTNFITIVQTRDTVAILAEKDHDVRIVRMGAEPWRPGDLRGWVGTSVGHWEDQILVVETAGYRPGVTMNGYLAYSDQSRVTERFTLTGPREMVCAFTFEDPSLYSQVWRGEILFRRTDRLLYEYACHEGNYSLPSILAAARQEEQAKMAAAKPAQSAVKGPTK